MLRLDVCGRISWGWEGVEVGKSLQESRVSMEDRRRVMIYFAEDACRRRACQDRADRKNDDGRSAQNINGRTKRLLRTGDAVQVHTRENAAGSVFSPSTR